jgi:predicted small metal-binding protein
MILLFSKKIYVLFFLTICSFVKTEECVFDTNKDSLNELTERLKQHFKTHHTPVMIDDTLKAYTLVGYGEVLLGSQTQPLLLRFDPHLFLYTKFEDYQQWVQQSGQRIDKIPEQGGVQWLTPTEIFISQRRSNRWLILFSFKEHITDV